MRWNPKMNFRRAYRRHTAADTATAIPENLSAAVDVAGEAQVLFGADLQSDSVESCRRNATARAARAGLVCGAIAVVAVGSLATWLGYKAVQWHHEDQQRAVFLQVARQVALNLTTIDHTEVDHDVQRILDSATGQFRSDFESRSQPFIDVVKRAQSTSRGTITESGLESAQGNQARVLLTVSVRTSSAGAADQQPRLWRMRVDVQDEGSAVKVSNVEFVP